ncbi:unnamed protein product [Anisakis simplex]|uniref:ING domain-containing protein n=1 Tax=Anisakis simplex TaxID=6269 RepID=A0A0M3KDL7_ANISI|nr:unnamed protein product [Anisakis simplex]
MSVLNDLHKRLDERQPTKEIEDCIHKCKAKIKYETDITLKKELNSFMEQVQEQCGGMEEVNVDKRDGLKKKLSDILDELESRKKTLQRQKAAGSDAVVYSVILSEDSTYSKMVALRLEKVSCWP